MAATDGRRQSSGKRGEGKRRERERERTRKKTRRKPGKRRKKGTEEMDSSFFFFSLHLHLLLRSSSISMWGATQNGTVSIPLLPCPLSWSANTSRIFAKSYGFNFSHYFTEFVCVSFVLPSFVEVCWVLLSSTTAINKSQISLCSPPPFWFFIFFNRVPFTNSSASPFSFYRCFSHFLLSVVSHRPVTPAMQRNKLRSLKRETQKKNETKIREETKKNLTWRKKTGKTFWPFVGGRCSAHLKNKPSAGDAGTQSNPVNISINSVKTLEKNIKSNEKVGAL